MGRDDHVVERVERMTVGWRFLGEDVDGRARDAPLPERVQQRGLVDGRAAASLEFREGAVTSGGPLSRLCSELGGGGVGLPMRRLSSTVSWNR